jgi:YD repeat-containing protein
MRQHIGISGTSWDRSSITLNYQENAAYDGNGNILTYGRNGAAPTAQTIDSLSYNYPRNASGRLTSNRLQNINDAIANSNYTGDLTNQTNTTNYRYDAIGNLIYDAQSNITGNDGVNAITWSVYGKIQSIYKTTGTISYTYDPSGQRVSKTANGLTTYYIPSDKDLKKHRGPLKPKDTYRHHYSFVVDQQLKTNNLLSDLEYSLPIIYNYHKPKVHFQQQYRGLQKTDYDTIVNGWVYATRTVFGKMVNAIPRQNKLEFMLRAIDNFSTIDFTKIHLMDGLEFLYEYIDARILSRGRILVATNNLIEKKLSDIIPPDEVGFISPDGEQNNKLSTQAKIFDELFSLEKKHNLRQSLKSFIAQKSEQEERFEKIFSKQTWPIDLSV